MYQSKTSRDATRRYAILKDEVALQATASAASYSGLGTPSTFCCTPLCAPLSLTALLLADSGQETAPTAQRVIHALWVALDRPLSTYCSTFVLLSLRSPRLFTHAK